MAKIKPSLIPFSTFITEGRDAPVYHATEIDNAIQMISNNAIIPYTVHPRTLVQGIPDRQGRTDQIVEGFSTTRSLRFARLFSGRSGVIFQLNQAKLAQKYRIVPVNHFSTYQKFPDKEEYEEFVISNKTVPLSSYLDAIYLISSNPLKSVEQYKANSSDIYFKQLDATIFSNPKFKGWI